MILSMWYVTETPCFPCAWRVVSDQYRTDNSSCHFFETRKEAQDEADRRNAQEPGTHWSEIAPPEDGAEILYRRED